MTDTKKPAEAKNIWQSILAEEAAVQRKSELAARAKKEAAQRKRRELRAANELKRTSMENLAGLLEELANDEIVVHSQKILLSDQKDINWSLSDSPKQSGSPTLVLEFARVPIVTGSVSFRQGAHGFPSPKVEWFVSGETSTYTRVTVDDSKGKLQFVIKQEGDPTEVDLFERDPGYVMWKHAFEAPTLRSMDSVKRPMNFCRESNTGLTWQSINQERFASALENYQYELMWRDLAQEIVKHFPVSQDGTRDSQVAIDPAESQIRKDSVSETARVLFKQIKRYLESDTHSRCELEFDDVPRCIDEQSLEVDKVVTSKLREYQDLMLQSAHMAPAFRMVWLHRILRQKFLEKSKDDPATTKAVRNHSLGSGVTARAKAITSFKGVHQVDFKPPDSVTIQLAKADRPLRERVVAYCTRNKLQYTFIEPSADCDGQRGVTGNKTRE